VACCLRRRADDLTRPLTHCSPTWPPGGKSRRSSVRRNDTGHRTEIRPFHFEFPEKALIQLRAAHSRLTDLSATRPPVFGATGVDNVRSVADSSASGVALSAWLSFAMRHLATPRLSP
jgi:hypothetical protein